MKLAKLSLAAIMTVGALSTANAAPLEEAIKGVDFSGMLRYRLNQTEVSGVKTGNSNDWDFKGQFTAPVTDNIKAVTIFASKSDAGVNQDGSSSAGMNVDLAKMFFVYKKDALTVKVGQMTIAHPLFFAGFNGSKGNGALAMYNAGAVTLAGAYFAGSNEGIDGVGSISDREISTVAAIGSMGPVNAQVWVSRIQDAIDTSIFVQADAKIEMVNLKGQFIRTKLNDTLGGESGNWFAGTAGAKFANIGLNLGFTKGDKDQGAYAVDVDDSSVIVGGWNLGGTIGNLDDASSIFGTVDGTFGKVNVMVGYAKGEAGTTDYAEYQTKISYPVSKNLKTYVRYSNMETDTAAAPATDYDTFRFEALYTF